MKSCILLLRIAPLAILLAVLSACGDDVGGRSAGQGRAGSLARFAVTASHLYAVDDDELLVYQLYDGGQIGYYGSVSLGMGVETITTRDTLLYIGTNRAMMIYDISKPSTPAFVSQFDHFVGCDPVVVQDTLAYVTLRTTGCRQVTANTIDIVNIKDPRKPLLVVTHGLQSPYGLGVDGELLFVCEGVNGLKVFNVSDPFDLKLVKAYPDVDAYDVIPNHGLLVLTGKTGVVQYDYTDHNNITELSTIGIQ